MEIELVKQVLQTLLPFLLRELLRHLHHGHDVVLHAHVAKYRRLLGKISYSLLRPLEHRQACNLLVIKEDSSCIRHYQSRDHIETGGLSGSVRTKEAHDLTLVHFHRNPFHNSPGAIFLDKVFAT